MSKMRKAVLQSDLFSCSTHHVIIFPINVKASTCIVSRMIPVSSNIVHLSKVFNIQALIHLNKEQQQVVWSVWLTLFSGKSLNHFNQLDVQKLDAVSLFFFWRQVVNFPKIHWHTIPYTGHDLCRVFGIQTAGLTNVNSQPNTQISALQ